MYLYPWFSWPVGSISPVFIQNKPSRLMKTHAKRGRRCEMRSISVKNLPQTHLLEILRLWIGEVMNWRDKAFPSATPWCVPFLLCQSSRSDLTSSQRNEGLGTWEEWMTKVAKRPGVDGLRMDWMEGRAERGEQSYLNTVMLWISKPTLDESEDLRAGIQAFWSENLELFHFLICDGSYLWWFTASHAFRNVGQNGFKNPLQNINN